MALPLRVQRGRAPSDAFELARNDFNTMLSHLFGGATPTGGGEAGVLAGLTGYGVDIREDADHVYIDADLPGFTKDEVNLSIENGTLTITAERREEAPAAPQQQQGQAAPDQQGQKAQKPEQKGEYLLRERRIERFVRSFTLPPEVDEQNVQAKLENGVLKITLNKRPESKPKRIEVS